MSIFYTAEKEVNLVDAPAVLVPEMTTPETQGVLLSPDTGRSRSSTQAEPFAPRSTGSPPISICPKKITKAKAKAKPMGHRFFTSECKGCDSPSVQSCSRSPPTKRGTVRRVGGSWRSRDHSPFNGTPVRFHVDWWEGKATVQSMLLLAFCWGI